MILIDAGALVALLNRGDRHHPACQQALRSLQEPLASAWPALAEAMVLVRQFPAAQQALLELARRASLSLLPLAEGDLPRLRQLLKAHARRSMTLGEAALVRLAEREGLDTVFTLNARGFLAYKIGGRKAFRVLP